MKIGKSVILLLTIISVLCLSSKMNFAAERESIPIGCVVSLTGYLSDLAQEMVEGIELAIEDINSKGGLLGRQLKLFVRDDELKPPVGVRRLEDLIKNEKIVMHTGFIHSATAMAAQQTGEKEKWGIPFMNMMSVPSLQRPGKLPDFGFLIGSSGEAYGLVGGEYVAQNLGKKGFLLYVDYAWGTDIRDAFVRSITANGGEIVGTLAVPGSTVDYQPFLTQIMVSKADYVVFIVNGAMFINCMKQAYAIGLKDKMKCVSAWSSSQQVDACGPEVIKDVILISDYYWDIPFENNKVFLGKFSKKYGNDKRPSLHYYYTYAGVNMWANVVRRIGTVDPKAVVANLPGLKGDFGKGEIEIRKTGDHTTIQNLFVLRGNGPAEMKNKLDTQKLIKTYTGEKYFYSPKEKGW